VKKIKELTIDSCRRKLDELCKQEVVYSNYVKRKIGDGIKAAEEGRIVSHDEVKRLFSQ
jgi:hypothetical protein